MKVKKILAIIAAGVMATTAMITTAFAAETVLFEGEQDWGSWKNMFSYPATTVKTWEDFTTDSVVTVSFKPAAANAQIKIATTSGKKYQSVYDAKGVASDQFDIAVGETTFKYSFDETDLNTAKTSGGLLMGGQNLIITKIAYAPKSEDVDPEPTDPKVAFIGDSICAGHDWAKTFGKDNIVNLGVGGYTTTDVLEKSFPKLYTEYDGFDAVFMICGVNDWNLDGFGSTTTYANSMANFKKMFELAAEKMPNATIIVTGPFPVLGSQKHNMTNGALPGYNAKLKELAAEYDNVRYVGGCWDALLDKTTNLGNADLYNTDGLHLNAAGYEAVNAVFKPYIDAIYSGEEIPHDNSDGDSNGDSGGDSIINSDSNKITDSGNDSKIDSSNTNKDDKSPQTGIVITFSGFVLASAVVLISKKKK